MPPRSPRSAGAALSPIDREALIDALATALVDDYLASQQQLTDRSVESPWGPDQTAAIGGIRAAAQKPVSDRTDGRAADAALPKAHSGDLCAFSHRGQGRGRHGR
jgi:hypothetical protein